MNEHHNHPHGAFIAELTVHGLWPLVLGPFRTRAGEDALAAELKDLLAGTPCRLDGLDYRPYTEVSHIEHLPAWQGWDTLLKFGIGARNDSLPDCLADLPLLRITLACNYLARMGYVYRNEAHGIALELSPEALALGMEVNIEGALIDTYGGVQGMFNAALFYVRMLGGDGLDELGREVLSDMLESVSANASAPGRQDPALH